MAKTYRVTSGTRMINRVFHAMTRFGIGKGYRHILTVRGRKSGRLYATPVDVMSAGGERWVVAAYGVGDWVRNARAAGEIGLSRGGRSESVRVVELGPEESVPVLRQYVREVPVTRAYFDVTQESTDEAFAAESAGHPVFRLEPLA
ncbi:nitroreductase family deazaflavin-dependent oxidoreductase [Streptomyces kanamyceticus]|uniref:Nitroreductase family deazaflavin-dependent oxidoreductase n=1 Tax=Streptomyces kanamyceticus TaxID=1967 RepID=A0A5J6G657_STRKN|nr:nitroreductase family deazaflavin-dependent oxidoreductase [Streptomyces kanamyceticus]QEU90094.1 nitroreductase family deazaflavin-dependent oxidoreductase [Streptomyces kanamyceticus]